MRSDFQPYSSGAGSGGLEIWYVAAPIGEDSGDNMPQFVLDFGFYADYGYGVAFDQGEVRVYAIDTSLLTTGAILQDNFLHLYRVQFALGSHIAIYRDGEKLAEVSWAVSSLDAANIKEDKLRLGGQAKGGGSQDARSFRGQLGEILLDGILDEAEADSLRASLEDKWLFSKSICGQILPVMWLKADEQTVGQVTRWTDSYDTQLVLQTSSPLQEAPTVAVVDSPTSIRLAKFGTSARSPLGYLVGSSVYPDRLLNSAAVEAWIVTSIDDSATMPEVITSLGSVAGFRCLWTPGKANLLSRPLLGAWHILRRLARRRRSAWQRSPISPRPTPMKRRASC
ncbi:unnamed protein product [Symbiodinium sp. CCMP2456]|nr:unnamed protein product [Symbiodinium sp. CCMP2456]